MNASVDRDLTGQRVAHYALLSLVGSGSMGKVYWARDERLRRDVAIKVVGGVPESRPERGNLLMNEARTLSRLHHPHVAGLYEYLTEDDSEFLVMEFVPGATLRDVLAGGPLPTAEVIRLGGQLVRGLAAAHDAKVLHQDIKPSNI
jgi:eukaryotic-like serine/threonine-protein kinase